jgi:hypothetical protein
MRISPPPRRRRSVLPRLLLLLLLAVLGLVVWAAFRDTEVPVQRIEQDVTNEALAG